MWWLVVWSGCPADTTTEPVDTSPLVTGDTAASTSCESGPDTCDGVDSDCDGEVDEDPEIWWYEDFDGDGAGNPERSKASCYRPTDHVAEPDDCVDIDADVSGAVGEVRWERVPGEASGLTLVRWVDTVRQCAQESLATGAAVGDVDDDGDLDVFLARMHLSDLLLLNDGTGVFTPAPGWSTDDGGSTGAVFFDVDSDRDLDLFVARLGRQPSQLFINQGDGTFTQEAAARGVALDPGVDTCSDQWGVSAGDVDGDGHLDLIVAGWQNSFEVGTLDRSRLLLNDGTGHFTDATEAFGLTGLWDRAPFSILLRDLDGDHLPELHAVSDWGLTAVWRNQGGSFVELDRAPYTDENGMGSDFGDVDGDGDLDWFVGSIHDDAIVCPDGWGCTGNRLYRFAGGGYQDVTAGSGVQFSQWTWGSVFVDRDLDGDVDLVTTGGYPINAFIGLAGRVFDNDGSGTFTEATCSAGWHATGQGRTLLPFDMDRDGDLDLLLVDEEEPATVWRAVGAEDKGWLTVELHQQGTNPYGIGAEITVQATASSPPQVRLLHANSLYLGVPAPEIHVGLGDYTGPVHEVRVRWPDGGTSIHTDVPQGHRLLTRP
ncbi:MAG: CRTAC1 family protein [Myxococcales bacterium]|nr:CRTAC1 family protein [Myxococcales bacterium]